MFFESFKEIHSIHTSMPSLRYEPFVICFEVTLGIKESR